MALNNLICANVLLRNYSLIMLHDLFLIRFFLIFLFVPCGGLIWLHVCFLLHVKYTISYCIVPYHSLTAGEPLLSSSETSVSHFHRCHFRPFHCRVMTFYQAVWFGTGQRVVMQCGWLGWKQSRAGKLHKDCISSRPSTHCQELLHSRSPVTVALCLHCRCINVMSRVLSKK